MRREIGVPVAQGLDVPNSFKDVSNFIKDVPNFLKDILNFLKNIPRVPKSIIGLGTTFNHFPKVPKRTNGP